MLCVSGERSHEYCESEGEEEPDEAALRGGVLEEGSKDHQHAELWRKWSSEEASTNLAANRGADGPAHHAPDWLDSM